MRPEIKVRIRDKMLKWSSFIISIIVLIWAVRGVNIDFGKFISGFSAIINIFGLMFPPDLSYLNSTLIRMMESVTIAFLGTFIGSLLAVPVAFFVASFGPGQLAGLLAVGIHSTGMLGKLYTDVIENIDPGPIRAMKASGANKLETLWYAVFPQILPEFIAISLYRFEINMQASTVNYFFIKD